MGRHFCPHCGSSVYAEGEGKIELHLGILDAPSQLMPGYDALVTRREAWLPPFPTERLYPGNRENGAAA